MRVKTEEALHREYGDLFDEEAGARRAHLIRSLDAGYRAPPIPPAVATFRRLSSVRPVPRQRSRSPRWAFAGPLAALAVAALVVAGSLAAAKPPKILNLGGPTTDVSPTGWVTLDDFHHIGTTVRSEGKPAVLIVDWLGDDNGDAERWPIVKALEQFGTLSRVSVFRGGCEERMADHTFCGRPSFNLSHARYQSKYVSFADREIAVLGPGPSQPYYPYQKISGAVLRLYERYAKPHVSFEYLNGTGPRIHYATVPMVIVGNYLAVRPEFVGRYDLFSSTLTSYTFSAIRNALLHDKSPAGRPTLVSDMNAEANVLTALICHADGKKPASVCGRPVIKRLLKLTR